MESLERLQGLHADLITFRETRLANVERLWQELQDSVQEFRSLLGKPQASAASREAFRKSMYVPTNVCNANLSQRRLL